MRKIILRMTAIAALAAFASHEARADDPLPIMRGILATRYAMISVYQVQPGREATFQAALLQSGPYNRRLQGFANERVLEASTTPMSEGPSSARTVGQRVICFLARKASMAASYSCFDIGLSSGGSNARQFRTGDP